jgi:hypothetical protein
MIDRRAFYIFCVATAFLSPATARNCKGSGTKNYYPSVNNSFPERTVFLKAEIKTGNVIWPGEIYQLFSS